MSMLMVSNSFGRGFSSLPLSLGGVLWSEVVDYDHGNSGVIQFSTSRIVITGPGTVRVYYERTLGFSGAVSADINTLSTTGAAGLTGGVNFVEVSTTVFFADQEAAQGYVDIEILEPPAGGFYYLVVELSNPSGGARIRNPEMHIYFDGSGANPSATVISGGADFSAALNSGGAGQLIYLRDDAEYTRNVKPSGMSVGGFHLSAAGTKTSRNFVMNYPGESPVINQNYDGTLNDEGGDTTAGIGFNADYLTVRGVEIRDTLSCGVIFSLQIERLGLVIEDCVIRNVGNPPNGIDDYPSVNAADNLAGIRPDHTRQAIFRFNTIHDMHDPRGTTPNNMCTGIHGYYVKEPWIHNNTIYAAAKGVYAKHPAQNGEFGYRVHNNTFYDLYDAAFLMQVAGSGSEGALDAVFYSNTTNFVGAAYSVVDHVKCFMSGMDSQSNNLWVYGNSFEGGNTVFNSRGINNIVYFNNDARGANFPLTFDGRAGTNGGSDHDEKISYWDYNNWYAMDSMRFTTSRYVDYNQYDTLASWQSAYSSGDAQILRPVGASSTQVESPSVGRFGLSIGYQ